MNRQHTNSEDTITTLFVEILMPMSTTWRIHEQTTKPLVENQRKPDVIIRTAERYPKMHAKDPNRLFYKRLWSVCRFPSTSRRHDMTKQESHHFRHGSINITQFTMEEVRCFSERQTLEIRPLTFLVGENSTGKTTTLASFHVLANYFQRRGVNFNSHAYTMGTFPYSMGTFKDIVRNSRKKRESF